MTFEPLLYQLSSSVFFVGFMGAGKTSVARRLARMCGACAIDTDRFLERRMDASISQVFEQCGQEGFRAIEAETLAEILQLGPALISCGGGIVLREQNRTLIKQNGLVVHLRVTADEAQQRISNFESRPLFSSIEAARELCELRAPLYDEIADVTIDTADKSTGKLAREVERELLKRGVLCKRDE